MKRVFFVAAAVCLTLQPQVLKALNDPPVISDPYSGFAMDGYDPVSYFTGAQPERGLDGVEARWGGTSWRFLNEGNRQAFLISPRLFAPGFSGYDPVALTHGFMTRGDPQIYVVYRDQLYFFFSSSALEEFHLHPAAAVKAAQLNWARLKNDR